MTRALSIAVALFALVTAAAIPVVAQSTPIQSRFTFKVANAQAAGPSGDSRLELVVNKWSTDAERDRVLAALKENGADKIGDAIGREYAVGYMHWPGNLNYALRYAYRVPRPDGGEDVIVGVDRPISLWWNAGGATSAAQPVVLQLRLNKDGRGEGKLSTKVTANTTAKTIVADDFASAPSTLIEVQREEGSSTSSSSS
jgi:hypothetical protein